MGKEVQEFAVGKKGCQANLAWGAHIRSQEKRGKQPQHQLLCNVTRKDVFVTKHLGEFS
ncbi:MAG: hypothetical protein JJT78_04690 [Leptospira sp.]|nr:hypothetical protein [Leptospira sp.]